MEIGKSLHTDVLYTETGVFLVGKMENFKTTSFETPAHALMTKLQVPGAAVKRERSL